MFYDFAITVPANTAQASPVTQELKLTGGVIHYVEFSFPSGCADITGGAGPLVHVQLRQPEASYLPTNPDGSFAADNYVIKFNEHKELKAGEHTLKAVLWNLDDTYAHTVTIRIGVLQRDAVLVLALAKFTSNLVSALSPRRIFSGRY